MIAILIHIYYPDSWEKLIRDPLVRIQQYAPTLLINLNKGSHNAATITQIKKDFPQAYIITTPNKGKDIGGKLALLDLFFKLGLQDAYVVLLHDKVSPHAITGDRWRTKLFSIIDPERIELILKTFQKDQKLGIVGAQDFITSEFNELSNELETTNRVKIQELLNRYHLTVTNYTFVAGTMFWIRSDLLKTFFKAHAPLSCREQLEEGDFTDQYEGTYTHSWERIFCWLATGRNYSIKGI